jgi:hypothetical protein
VKGTAQATPTKVPVDSPAMGTRSKKKGENSRAKGTKAKKRLTDLL